MNIFFRIIIFLIIGLLAISVCSAQEENRKVVSPKDFYIEALRDNPEVVSFSSTVEWLQNGSIILLDVRSEKEFKQSHIKGAINLPATELTGESLAKVIPSKNFKIVIYCENNVNPFSRMVPLTTLSYPTIKQLGYKNVFILQSTVSKKEFPLPLEGKPDK